jgi:hypothetical protein
MSLEFTIPRLSNTSRSNAVDTLSSSLGSIRSKKERNEEMIGDTKRVTNELRESFASIREVCSVLRHVQPRDTTSEALKEHADNIHLILEKCEEMVSALPHRVAEMAAREMTNTKLSSASGRKSFASTVRQATQVRLVTQLSNMSSLSIPSPCAPPTPRPSVANPSRLPTNLLPDMPGRSASVLVQPSEAASEKMMSLARGLYLTIEAAARAIGAEKALLCVPNRGVKEDLRVVAYCGFDATAPEHRSKDSKSVEFGVLQSKLLVNCTSGTNPPHEVDYDGVLHYFQDALSDSGTRDRAAEALGTGVALTSTMRFVEANSSHVGGGTRRSLYWSKLYCPVRRDASAQPLGVIAFLQKDHGTANFTSDDEHVAFGTAAIVAAMLQRCSDYELLARCSDQIGSSVPSLIAPHVQSVAMPGSHSQLVYRTNDLGTAKDVKILSGEGTATERLDIHTPLQTIANYIVRLQQSWRNAVLLNSTLSKTHEDRTKVVTSLLARARVSEFRNEALMAERVAAIPISRKPLFEKPKPPVKGANQHPNKPEEEPLTPNSRTKTQSFSDLEMSGLQHEQPAQGRDENEGEELREDGTGACDEEKEDEEADVEVEEEEDREETTHRECDDDERMSEQEKPLSSEEEARKMLFGTRAAVKPTTSSELGDLEEDDDEPQDPASLSEDEE